MTADRFPPSLQRWLDSKTGLPPYFRVHTLFMTGLTNQRRDPVEMRSVSTKYCQRYIQSDFSAKLRWIILMLFVVVALVFGISYCITNIRHERTRDKVEVNHSCSITIFVNCFFCFPRDSRLSCQPVYWVDSSRNIFMQVFSRSKIGNLELLLP